MLDVVLTLTGNVDYGGLVELYKIYYTTFDAIVTRENYKPHKTGFAKVTFVICRFKEPVSTSNALQYMKHEGIEQPEAPDLISVGLSRSLALHRILDQKRLICLCQPHQLARDKLFVPLIWQLSGGRHVVVDRSNGRRWETDELFLGVKPQTKE